MDVETPTEPAGASPHAPPTRRRFRLGIGMILGLIAAIAPAIALYARILGAPSPPGPDLAPVLLVGVLLSGLAVAAARKATVGQFLAQFGLSCAAVLAFAEWEGDRIMNYYVLGLFAATVVVPMLARRALGAGAGARRERVRVACAVACDVGLNLAAMLVLLVVNSSWTSLLEQIVATQSNAGAVVAGLPGTPSAIYVSASPSYAYMPPSGASAVDPSSTSPTPDSPAVQGATVMEYSLVSDEPIALEAAPYTAPGTDPSRPILSYMYKLKATKPVTMLPPGPGAVPVDDAVQPATLAAPPSPPRLIVPKDAP